MIRVTDQIGCHIELPNPAKRIISCVPSLTELLFDLSLQNEVVGRTKFCIHPSEKVKFVEKCGGTKNLQIEKIINLQPDLIICAKEENEREQIESLKNHFQVYTTDIKNIPDNIEAVLHIGLLTGKTNESQELMHSIKANFLDVPKPNPTKTCVYLIWHKPIMTVGGDSFINEMLRYAGFRNLMDNQKRYPTISEKELLKLNPQYVLLSSEPFPFKEKHLKWYSDLLPQSKVLLVDGELFSWYGSRLLKTAEYFKALNAI